VNAASLRASLSSSSSPALPIPLCARNCRGASAKYQHTCPYARARAGGVAVHRASDSSSGSGAEWLVRAPLGVSVSGAARGEEERTRRVRGLKKSGWSMGKSDRWSLWPVGEGYAEMEWNGAGRAATVTAGVACIRSGSEAWE
jgi:hypothetical protein